MNPPPPREDVMGRYARFAEGNGLLFRPEPERQTQPIVAGQDANVGFRQIAAITTLVTVEIQRRSDRG